MKYSNISIIKFSSVCNQNIIESDFMRESILFISKSIESESSLEILLYKSGFIPYFISKDPNSFDILTSSNISVIVYSCDDISLFNLPLFEQIKKNFPSLKIIVLSSIKDFTFVLSLIKLGVYDFLEKPINYDRLILSINSAIQEKKNYEEKLNEEKRSRDIQKTLIEELNTLRKELEELRSEIKYKNIDLEKAYGSSYLKFYQKEKENQIKQENKIGKYSILEEVGRGGMSVVYKANDPVLSRIVAIKELTISEKSLPSDVIKDVVKRFQREARVMAGLRHDNIIKVYDVIEDKLKQYMIMEYVEGKTLDTVISSVSQMPVLEAVSISAEICLALDYIHSQKIIHRDIKPSNIMLSEDRSIKLMDFGVIRDTSSSTITPTGSIIGTLSYTAPEQSLKIMDHRVDIFSLGTVLYELLTGINPFESKTYAETFIKISSYNPPPPSHHNPKCNPILDQIVLKAMEKNPNKRFLTAKDFYVALVKFSQQYQELKI